MLRILLPLLLLLPDGLTPEDFDALHRRMAPPKSEAWRRIGWNINLLQVQADAAREKKPIFIWSMDGNPLGCG